MPRKTVGECLANALHEARRIGDEVDDVAEQLATLSIHHTPKRLAMMPEELQLDIMHLLFDKLAYMEAVAFAEQMQVAQAVQIVQTRLLTAVDTMSVFTRSRSVPRMSIITMQTTPLRHYDLSALQQLCTRLGASPPQGAWQLPFAEICYGLYHGVPFNFKTKRDVSFSPYFEGLECKDGALLELLLVTVHPLMQNCVDMMPQRLVTGYKQERERMLKSDVARNQGDSRSIFASEPRFYVDAKSVLLLPTPLLANMYNAAHTSDGIQALENRLRSTNAVRTDNIFFIPGTGDNDADNDAIDMINEHKRLRGTLITARSWQQYLLLILTSCFQPILLRKEVYDDIQRLARQPTHDEFWILVYTYFMCQFPPNYNTHDKLLLMLESAYNDYISYFSADILNAMRAIIVRYVPRRDRNSLINDTQNGNDTSKAIARFYLHFITNARNSSLVPRAAPDIVPIGNGRALQQQGFPPLVQPA